MKESGLPACQQDSDSALSGDEETRESDDEELDSLGKGTEEERDGTSSTPGP